MYQYVEFSVSPISIPRAFVVVTCYGSILGSYYTIKCPNPKEKESPSNNPFQLPLPGAKNNYVVNYLLNHKETKEVTKFSKVCKDI